MPISDMSFSRSRNGLLILLAVLMLIMTLIEGMKVGADKVLPGPMTRHRDAISIALTYVQYGKWLGYASYVKINQTLNDSGLNLQDPEVKALGYQNYFDVMRHPEVVDRALAAAASIEDVASDGLYYLDGNEKGMAIYYILSFLIFGLHIAGFFYLYVVILSISAGIYALTFWNNTRALLFLVALLAAHLIIVLVCQRLPDDVSVIHGARFISSLTLPAMFQLMFLSQCRQRPSALVLVGTCLQVLLLMLFLNARNTTLWEVIAVLAYIGGCAGFAYLRRLPRTDRPALWPAGTLAVGLLLLQLSHHVGLNPHYLSKDGTSGHVFWHAVTLAINNNPQRTIKFGISPGIPVWDDQVAYDLFDKEIAARGLKRSDFLLPDNSNWKLHTSAPEWDFNWAAYDNVMRDIVLQQIASEPLYVAKSLFLYQPMATLGAVATIARDALLIGSLPPLLLLALGVLIAGRKAAAPGMRILPPLAFALPSSLLSAIFVAIHPVRVIDFSLILLIALLWATCRIALRALLQSTARSPSL